MQESMAAAPIEAYESEDGRVAMGAHAGWEAVPWAWSCVMVVCFDKTRLDKRCPDSTLLVNPSRAGLNLLAELETEIQSISLLFPPEIGEARPRVETVQNIVPWPSADALSGEQMALCCASGHVFVCGHSNLQEVASAALWSVGRRCRPGSTAAA